MPLQDVLELVRNSAADFDAVCMATALHKMASLDADPHQYQLLADRPELTRLKDMICELHPMIVATCDGCLYQCAVCETAAEHAQHGSFTAE